MADSTLNAIRIKVRRLTRSPSVSQISDADIDEYVNTFILYDMPEQLRLFSLRTTFSFYTQPFIDTYETSSNPLDPLFNFKNLYTSMDKPVYIAGYEAFFTQSREEFYGIYPLTTSLVLLTSGNGVTTHYTGTLSGTPVLRGEVLFDSVDTNNNGLELHDDSLGNLTGIGTGTIDYVTGAYVLDFSTPPASGQAINSQTYIYVPTRPSAMCYFDDKFILRPVPDQPYKVQFEVYARPTALLAGSDKPELEQWWQYFAYGAAKKVLEDRLDMDSVSLILPEFKQQERLVLRKTIVENTKERTATIYTNQHLSGNQWWPSTSSF